jgi:gentisate 1,2-dioxygenase
MPQREGEPAVPDVVTPLLAGPGPRDEDRWEPVVLRRDAIEQAVQRLLEEPRADADLRRALIVHPRAAPHGTGLAPGIQVALEVLRPGEDALPPRRSSSALTLQLAGEASVTVNGEHRRVGRLDVVSLPPLAVQHVAATSGEAVVRLVYSNAALLDHLGVHVIEPIGELDGSEVRPLRSPRPLPAEGPVAPPDGDARVARIGDAWRLLYERLIDPPWTARRSWHWRWEDVERELDRMAALDERYRGRRVCVLHDPSTGATNGTTTTLFASMCIRPAGIVDRTHRHASAGVNYFIAGRGWSVVDGRRIEWSAGDLVFIAPGWATHHHASGPEPVQQLAVQDNPLHLAMGSLVWQEDLAEAPRLLGAEPGFSTNRDSLTQ